MKSAELKDQLLDCTRCELCSTGNGPVPFRGRRSPVMIVGEAPGSEEDDLGRPFVGPAGKLLFRTLAKHGIERSDVFTTNAVSCFPNRKPAQPTQSEIETCRRNLYDQISFCKPRVILALGNTANTAIGSYQDRPMKVMKNWWYNFPALRSGLPAFGLRWDILVLSTYHPSAVLRNQVYTRDFREGIAIFAKDANMWLRREALRKERRLAASEK